MSLKLNLKGQRFGRWTVLKRTSSRRWGSYWVCICDCGTRKEVSQGSLRRGDTRSCGCLRVEVVRALFQTHGHGHPISPEYRAWRNMINRCERPATKEFKDYGARGIRVCPRWRSSFENFLADIGLRPSPNHSLDRVDNDGNYEPGNCRWATRLEQQHNKRRAYSRPVLELAEALRRIPLRA